MREAAASERTANIHTQSSARTGLRRRLCPWRPVGADASGRVHGPLSASPNTKHLSQTSPRKHFKRLGSRQGDRVRKATLKDSHGVRATGSGGALRNGAELRGPKQRLET